MISLRAEEKLQEKQKQRKKNTFCDIAQQEQQEEEHEILEIGKSKMENA